MKSLKLFHILLMFLLAGVLFRCGSNSGPEAMKAYEAGDYTTAIRLFSEARQKTGNDTLYQEELALSYLYRGKELYEKTRNIGSFAGNYEKAKSFIPEDHSERFRKEYSSLLTELSRAYTVAKPETDLEEEDFFNSSVEIVRMAINEDSTNQAAHDLLAEIKQDHFQGIIDKAKDLYQKAGKTGQLDLYFVSEYIFKQAADLDPDHKEVQKYLNLILGRTLGVLNYREGVALAVTGYDHNRGRFSLSVSVQNYLPDPMHLKLDNFRLVDSHGKNYPIDSVAMKQNDLLGMQVLSDIRLDHTGPLTEGNLVFIVPDTAEIKYIGYVYNQGRSSRKYFP